MAAADANGALVVAHAFDAVVPTEVSGEVGFSGDIGPVSVARGDADFVEFNAGELREEPL
jgi:hypothetical protein